MLFTDFFGRVTIKPLPSANRVIKIIFYKSPFRLLISLYFEIRWRNKSELPYQTLSLLQLSDWTAFVSAFLFPLFSPPTEQKSVCIQSIVLYFCTSIFRYLRDEFKKNCWELPFLTDLSLFHHLGYLRWRHYLEISNKQEQLRLTVKGPADKYRACKNKM